jgi:carbonic anhydrase
MITSDKALARLLAGNVRYVTHHERTIHHFSCPKTRKSLVSGQQPYAIILACSDSRVPPEIVFDTGLGEIFVVRVAGNVPDSSILGSIEYAAAHLGSPLLMVLGHCGCGAVTAAVDAHEKKDVQENHGGHDGHIGSIIRSITPAVALASENAGGTEKTDLIEAAIDCNVRLVGKSLVDRSAEIRKRVEDGSLRIVCAKYDLHDGHIHILDD